MLNSLAFSLMAFTAPAEGPAGEGVLMSAPFELRYDAALKSRHQGEHGGFPEAVTQVEGQAGRDRSRAARPWQIQ
jgi:hypothetical protein